MTDDALSAAEQRQAEAALTGFDWPEPSAVLAKVEEELGELRQALDQGSERQLDEMGDLLFVLVNLCRHLQLSPAEALRHATRKFDRRFGAVMAGQAQWSTLNGEARLAAMERLWQLAKQSESKNS